MKLKGKWKSLGSSVYQAENGTKIHIGGLIKPVDNDIIYVNTLNWLTRLGDAISISGGNRKRGLMLLAEQLT